MELPDIFIHNINSFNSQRNFYFQIQGQESPKINMNFGVSRGSSISPILFILYVSDILKPTIIQKHLQTSAEPQLRNLYCPSHSLTHHQYQPRILKFLCILFDNQLIFLQHITQTKTRAQNIITQLHTTNTLAFPTQP